MRTYSVCVYHNEKPANLTPYTALASASKVHGPYTSIKKAKELAASLEDCGFDVEIVEGA
jgi:hypothetical protein